MTCMFFSLNYSLLILNSHPVFFQILTTLAGTAMSLGYYPQAYAIYKKKSTENISLFSYTIFAIGTLIWMLYGFYLHDWTIIASFVIGVIGSWLVLGLTLYYNRKNRK